MGSSPRGLRSKQGERRALLSHRLPPSLSSVTSLSVSTAQPSSQGMITLLTHLLCSSLPGNGGSVRASTWSPRGTPYIPHLAGCLARNSDSRNTCVWDTEQMKPNPRVDTSLVNKQRGREVESGGAASRICWCGCTSGEESRGGWCPEKVGSQAGAEVYGRGRTLTQKLKRET